jgi:hypothetical protein
MARLTRGKTVQGTAWAGADAPSGGAKSNPQIHHLERTLPSASTAISLASRALLSSGGQARAAAPQGRLQGQGSRSRCRPSRRW